MARVITEAIVQEYGRDEFLERLAHPFWFQSFGALMGMDWHSSGITTSVLGSLKAGLAPISSELGLFVCGGRGRHSLQTPNELVSIGEKTGFDGDDLAHKSRLVAKVDSAAVQDGFQLYLHSFVVTSEGQWTVVQQGMNTNSRQARRYHWLSRRVNDFVDEPHSAIEGPAKGEIINLTDKQARQARQHIVDLSHHPDRVLNSLALPSHHPVTVKDVNLKRLRASLTAAANRGPVDFPELLMTRGVGPRTVESLALVAELIHGAPCRFRDPARFSFAHGGKDGHPFPVPTRVFDETVRVLKGAVAAARLGNEEKLAALRRLDKEARMLERVVEHGESFESLIASRAREVAASGGRTVKERKLKSNRQLRLFR